MKKIALLLSTLTMVLLALACSNTSSKGNYDDDEDEDESTEFSTSDLKDEFNDAVKECAGWTADDCLEFHKERIEMYIDFYKSDPSAEDWLELRDMEQKYMAKMAQKMGLPESQDWPYVQADGYRPDKEAKKLDAKLKKVYTKWKKAHAEELAEVIARPQEEDTSEGGDAAFDDDTNGADDIDPSDNTIYDVAEVMPQFAEGDLTKWISDRLNYPTDAKEAGKDGLVVCQVIIEKDGSVSDATVTKSVFPSLDSEALRIIESMPRWTPGRQNGKRVRARFTIPVRFKL